MRNPIDKFALFSKLGYQPHEGQVAFHLAVSENRFILLCAGTRFGKSFAAAKEAVWFLLNPSEPVRVWLVAPDYELGEKEFRYVVDDLRALSMPMTRCVENKHSGDMHVRLATGSEIQVKSAKNDTSLLGEEVDLLILCEGSKLSRDTWTRYLRGRIASRLGKVIVPTTPSGVDDFLYPMFYEPAVQGKKGYWYGQYSSNQNPHFPDDLTKIREEFERAGRMEDYAEQYEGKFVHRTGLVFKDFRRDVHVVEPFDPPAEWARYRAIDPGFADPFVCLWAAIGPDGTVYVYREWYQRRQILSAHAKHILEWKEPIAYTVIDPSACAARVDSGIPLTVQLAELGIHTVPGYAKDRQVRAWRIAEYLKMDVATGKPKLYIFRNCANTIHEFETFSYVETKDGKNVHDKMKEKDDHSLDALGYLLMTRPRRHFEDEKLDPRSFRAYNKMVKDLERKPNLIGDDQRDKPPVTPW